MDASQSKQVADLRRRAQWYRDMAGIGQGDLREWRIKFAAMLDKQADEIQRQAK